MSFVDTATKSPKSQQGSEKPVLSLPPPATHDPLDTQSPKDALSGPSTTLPYQSELEAAFHTSFAHVRVYTHEAAQRAAAELHVPAFAVGSSIGFASEDPSKRLVAHELAHVIQQGQAGQADGHGTDLEAEAEQAASEATTEGPVRVPLSPAGGVQLQTFDFGGAVASVSSAVSNAGAGISDAASGAADAASEALDTADQALNNTFKPVLDIRSAFVALGPAKFLQLVGSWALNDINAFIIDNPYNPVIRDLIGRLPTEQLAEIFEQVQAGASAGTQVAGEAASGAARMTLPLYIQYLKLERRLTNVLLHLLVSPAADLFIIARDNLPPGSLAWLANRVQALATWLFEQYWPVNTGSRASLQVGVGASIPVTGLAGVLVKGGQDGGADVAVTHLDGGDAPAIKFTVTSNSATKAGVGVQAAATMVNAAAVGGPQGVLTLGGTLFLSELNSHFWTPALLDVLESGSREQVLDTLIAGGVDLASSVRWQYSQDANLAGGVEAGVGDDVIGVWVQAFVSQGFEVDVLTPTKSSTGRISATTKIDRSVSVGAGFNLLGDTDLSGSVLGIASLLMSLKASAGLSEEVGAQISFEVPSIKQLDQGELPQFSYVDFYHELSADMQLATEQLGVTVGQGLRITAQGIADSWEGLDANVEPRELIKRLPFSSLRFNAAAAFKSQLLGLLTALGEEPSVMSMLEAGGLLLGSVDVQLNITKDLIIDIISELWTSSPPLAAAILRLDGPAIILELGTLLGNIGDILYQAIEYVTVYLERRAELGAGGSVEVVSGSAGASVGKFYTRKYAPAELGELVQSPDELSTFVRKVLLMDS